MSVPIPRLFVLRRDRDVTGVSGAGDVADGVQWPDGSIVLRWRERPSTSVWDGLELMLSVHGHDGATRAVWAEDIAAEHRKLSADIVAAFDVPGRVVDPQTEREALRRECVRAMTAEHERRARERVVASPEEHCAGFADAVMPIVYQVLQQRDRAHRVAGRAYQLADRWEAAHGSAFFLVRAAGAELRSALDDSELSPREVVHSETDAQVSGFSGVDYVAAAECSAQHRGYDERQCIRAAQHRGDHIDEHGFHWSDTVAIYPVMDGEPRYGRAAASSCTNPDHACTVCGDCMHEHLGEGGCPEAPNHPVHMELATAQAVIADLRTENRALRAKADRLEPALIEQDRLADELKREQAASRGLAQKIREQRAALDQARTRAENHPRRIGELRLSASREKERADRAKRQRNDVAQALREVLAAFREIPGLWGGDVAGYEAPHPVHPSDFNRWRTVFDGLPANCKKIGGCSDCPHETEA